MESLRGFPLFATHLRAKYGAKTSCGGLKWDPPPYLRRKNGTYGMHTQTPYWPLLGSKIKAAPNIRGDSLNSLKAKPSKNKYKM
jgi:hypothetical protein